MAQELPVVKFSENGEYLAYSDPSGILKVWQTSNNKLHREYVPSSHLSATCTCISWAPTNTNREMPVAKKRKLSLGIAQTVRELTFIAMGTASGSVLLYSVKNGDLYTMMKDGHSGRVNAICWHVEEDSLFSCGSDHFIVQWSLSTSTVKQKWNSGKGEVFSISLCHTQNHLLTAGRVIQLWDWRKKEVLQTFLGHSTEVFHLVQIPNIKGPNGSTSNNVDASHLTIEGSYIISSAVGDNKISVRQITENSAHKNRDLVCSFSLPEDPIYVDVFPPSEDSQLFRLIAVTRSGTLVFFEHMLNGCQRKPLKPKSVVHLVTKKTDEKSSGPPRSMAIAVAGFARERQRNIVIAYENLIRPVFESLLPSELQPCMEREDPKIRKIQVEESILQLKQPIIPKDVTVLGPGQPLPMTPSRRRENMKRRRSITEMTIEERLKAIGPTEADPKSQKRTVPKADNMAVLLEQGLASGDKTILNNVLQKTDEVIIRNTIMRLRFTAILPLLKELGRRLRGHAQSALNDVNWLKQVIWGHYNYLVTVPDVDVVLNPLLSILNVPLHRLQRSIACKQNIEKTLATVNAVKRYQSSKVDTEKAVCEFVQEESDIDD